MKYILFLTKDMETEINGMSSEEMINYLSEESSRDEATTFKYKQKEGIVSLLYKAQRWESYIFLDKKEFNQLEIIL